MTDESSLEAEVTREFEHSLNRHGHGFQAAVIRILEDRAQRGQSPWRREASEFPVEVNGVGTRIDIVLKDSRGVNPLYMLAECKRVDPALGRWCFIRTRPHSAQGRIGYSFFERAVWNSRSIPSLRAKAVGYALSPDAPYHIGVEVKVSQKGDGTGGSKSSIEDASTQISRGQSGFINFLAHKSKLADSPVLLLPVIFTTAELWASEISLSHAEASSGHIDLSSKPMQPKPWLLYQYVLSPGIKHTYVYGTGNTLGDILDADYIRTIAIVSVAGIDLFLEWATDLISYHHQPTG